MKKDPFKYLDPVVEGLDVDRKNSLIDGLAKKIVEIGMVAPSIIFFESVKPLTTIGSYTLLLFLAPYLELFGKNGFEYVALFKDRRNIESLLNRIEELSKEEEKKG
jgi:hypothetical protein